MKKMIVIQITAILVISGALGGILYSTDVYSEVYSRIMSVICLSCIKLDSVISLDFTFDTANGKEHPDSVINLLKKGPIFLSFRTQVCEYCDQMEPVIKQMFNLTFEKEDVFNITVNFNGTEITFFHINTDFASEEQKDLQSYYNIAGASGANIVPMFTTITLGYHHGFVRPIYNTVYGILNKDYTDDQRINLLTGIIKDGIELYIENRPGFIP